MCSLPAVALNRYNGKLPLLLSRNKFPRFGRFFRAIPPFGSPVFAGDFRHVGAKTAKAKDQSSEERIQHAYYRPPLEAKTLRCLRPFLRQFPWLTRQTALIAILQAG